MRLSDLVNLIEAKNYQFEIGIEGKTFKRKTAQEVLSEYDSLSDYFRKIAQVNRVPRIGLTLFAKNGSSFLRKGFFLVEIEPVETPNKPVEYANNVVETLGGTSQPCPIHGPHIQPQTLSNMDSYSEILKVRLDYADQKTQELERRNKELERKNDELYNENLKLTRDNLTQKDKLELEYRQKEFDLVTQQKQGLNGLMESAQNLPAEAWALIAGLINPNHPLTKQNDAPAPMLEGATKKHPDPDANACIEMLSEILIHQRPESVGMIFTIIQALIHSPETLQKTYLQFNPQNNLKAV